MIFIIIKRYTQWTSLFMIATAVCILVDPSGYLWKNVIVDTRVMEVLSTVVFFYELISLPIIVILGLVMVTTGYLRKLGFLALASVCFLVATIFLTSNHGEC
jgi:hypothetical protein